MLYDIIIILGMSQSYEEKLQAKQKYLRDHIGEQQYQQFGQFCYEVVGNQDIHLWSIEFIQQLVEQFKQSHSERTNAHQTSFHIYQTTTQPNNQPTNLPINQPINPPHQVILQPIPFPKTNKTYNVPSPTLTDSKVNKKSAVDLLEQVFSRVQKSANSSPPSDTKLKPHSFADNNFFNTVNFWAIPQSNNNFKKVEQTKNSSIENLKTPQQSVFSEFFNQGIIEKQPIKKSPQIVKQPKQQIKKVVIKNQSVDSFGKEGKQKIVLKGVKTLNQSQLSQRQRKICNKINYDGPIVFKQKFQDVIPCFKSLIRAPLSDPNLTIVISKHQIVNRSFFVPDYVMYTLKILPSNFQCKRNYQDFVRLRDSLERVYPAMQLPYLQKKSWFSQTNADLIKKQKTMLEYFLSDILRNQQLRNSRIFEDFLTLAQHKKMKRKFQQYDKMEKVSSIQQLCLLQGQVNVSITEEHRIYLQKSSNFLNKMEQILQRHQTLTSTLSYQYQCLLSTLASLSQLMKQSDQEIKKFNNQVTIHQLSNLSQVFQTINKAYKQKYLQSKFQYDIINKKILPFITYQTDNLRTITQLINNSKQMTRKYIKRLQTQSISTNQPYLSEKLKNYKQGILQESKNLFIFKYQVGFINSQACKETERFFNQMGKKFLNKWQYIADKQLQRNIQSSNFWKELKDINVL